MGVAACDHLGSDPQHQGGCGYPLPSVTTFITNSGQMPNFSREDLFASLANNHVLQPVSSPPSAARVCPVIPWEGTRSLRFPPPARVTRVLLKIELDGAFSILLTAPCWPSRAWFPKLVRLLTGQPLGLPPASRPTGPTSLSHG